MAVEVHVRNFFFRATLVGVALFAATPAANAAVATTAADVCPNNANPCNVTSVFDVTDNATLDFGVRALNITGAGQFNFGTGSGSILSGPFTAVTANPVIDANGYTASGTDSGTITIEARRLCSQGPPVPCVALADCQRGACDTRRCTGRSALHCLSDTTCSGTCTNKHCSNTPTFVRCSANADCNFGTCGAQLQCHDGDATPIACASNTDCQFGECTTGTASISLGGAILGNSDMPATIELRAADNVEISRPVNLTGSSFDSDGGRLTVAATLGSILLADKITAPSGGNGAGGVVKLKAGLDVMIGDDITVTGGDFDGGAVQVSATRDITIHGNLIANSTAGAGFGGEIVLSAGRDLAVNAVSALDKTSIQTNGHTAADNNSGDGGAQDLSAGRDLMLGANTVLQGIGAAPSGYGSEFTLSAGRSAYLDGEVTARSNGVHGQGGSVQVAALGDVHVGAGAKLNAVGGDEGGGDVGISGGTAVDFAGFTDVSASSGGGTAALASGGVLLVSGTLHVAGATAGTTDMTACSLSLAQTAVVDNTSSNGSNRFESRGSMHFEAGSLVSCPSGANLLSYRYANDPPVLAGVITPEPQVLLDPTILPCGNCGDGTADQYEQCDDGNLADGDGCDSNCTNTSCGNGIPTAGEDCDDGNKLDTDECTSACVAAQCGDGNVWLGVEECDDANTSNTDGCSNACVTAKCGDGLLWAGVEICDDSNLLSGDGCDATCTPTGCGNGVVTSGEECDDGNQSIQDACTNTCKVAKCGDGLLHAGVEQCDDGNTLDTDSCLNSCQTASCGDGAVRAGAEQCDDGNTSSLDSCIGCVVATCGDGYVRTGVEQCDDMNTVDTDACPGNCKVATCGDGFVRSAVEQCDDGNVVDSDACTAACKVATCGDGFVRQDVEECDDGNSVNTDACPTTCRIATCGDGFVHQATEECDDKNALDGDGCSRLCERQQLCGDANGDGAILASDSLRILQRAVKIDVLCPTWICNVDGVNGVGAGDGLRILRQSVGIPTALACGAPTSLVIRVLSQAVLGALQIDVGYGKVAGEIDGSAETVHCEAIQDGVQAAFNDKPTRVLSASFVSTAGIRTPATIARCGFRPERNVDPEDFSITILDSRNLDGEIVATPALKVFPD